MTTQQAPTPVSPEGLRPLLTIAIPTFNREHVLRRRMQELERGVTPGVGVVVVDNASPDGTWALLGEAAARHPWLRVARNDRNLGCDANYLRVIEESDGEWCWLLGDDEPVSWSQLPALVERLRSETAAVVHLVTGDVPWNARNRTFFEDAESFLGGFYDLFRFPHLSSNVVRTAVAKRHLSAAAPLRGLLHAYVPVVVKCLEAGGLRVHPSSILSGERPRRPRWRLVEGHLGAWETMHASFPRRMARRIDRLEAAGRAREVVQAAVEDLLGLGPSALTWAQVGRMLHLFPLRHYGLFLKLLGARAAWLWPDAFAALRIWLLRLGCREARLADLAEALGTSPGPDLRPALARAIRARARVRPGAAAGY